MEEDKVAATASEVSDVQAVATTTDNVAVATLSEADQAALDELMAGSGEADQGGNYVKIPYISIDNRMEEETIQGKDGKPDRVVKVRCEPRFTVTEKIGTDYVTELFAPEFEAVILKFKHRVQRKYLQDQQGKCLNELKFYRSLEFGSFNDDIYVRQGDEFLKPMKYGELKNWAGDENELWGVVYFIIPGEDTVRKAEFKGASRSVLYDFMTASRARTISSYITKFSAEVVEDATPYNKLKLELIDRLPENLVKLAAQQKELNAMLDRMAKPSKPPVHGTVMGGALGTGKEVTDVDIDEGIKVNAIPFD